MKRFIATASAVFERFVDQVENHEAVADSRIREVAASAAQLHVHNRRISAELERLHELRARQEVVRDRWKSRAARFAGSDEDKALECVRRMRATERMVQALAGEIEQQTGLAEQLRHDLDCVEERLRALRLRRTSLAARGARSRALAGSAEACGVETLFDRWEAQVARDEYQGGDAVDQGQADRFARAFDQEEDAADLRVLLDSIRQEAGA
jgi:phage shock protein A